jgi:type 1 glutamine amidotransferase
MARKILRLAGWLLLLLAVLIGLGAWWNWDNIQRHFLGGVKVYETTSPALPAEIKRPALLVFSKTNGYRHEDSIAAAGKLLEELAAQNGWGVYRTENGAVFNAANLARFDAVVFNNVSGDVFTPDQRAAFKAFVENGGGFVGFHASGGDFSYAWDWYRDTLIGAQFIGHPLNPQFQQGRIVVETKDHPATSTLPAEWSHTDEWYSFDRSVRGKPGFTVLATLDEASFANHRMKILWMSTDLVMGKDHPIAWSHCVGQGRVFYSAPGHLPAVYAVPEYRTLLTGALRWALKLEGKGCEAGATP